MNIRFASLILALPLLLHAAPDPNFHIYIAYGQSNMAGAGDIRNGIDNVEHPRYKMFATTECAGLGRPTLYEVYPAIPPMFHCGEGLSVADWFGRAMADALPDVTVGIIPVAVGGTKIELFDKDKYAQYLNSLPLPNDQYLINWAKDYGSDGNAHARIVETAKKAMEVGVIKGIIFHQGESGSMNGNNWQQEVKKTRDDILQALGLSSDTIPFLAGGLEEQDAGGCCWSFSRNNIKTLPNVMDNTYFVSSDGLSGNGKDSFHFSSASYEEFGKRYAEEMLKHIKLGPVVLVPRSPYGNKASEIPGKIEAENFDIPGTGSENKTFSDTDSQNRGDSDYRKDDAPSADLYDKATGVILGYNQEGEWFEYTINVMDAGDYNMTASVATDNDVASFSLSLDGNPLVENIDSLKTGSFDSYKDVQVKVTLPAGEHTLRMTVISSWFDIDYLNFEKIPSNSSEANDSEKAKDSKDSSITTTPDKKQESSAIALAKKDLKLQMEQGFRLFDVHGRLVASFSATGMDNAIRMVQDSFKGIHQGVYLLRSTGSEKSSQKIILKK
jgi:hypothetical protein